ncbi:zinc finger protein 593-like protein isoform X1 [Entamoeba marina]
MPQRRKKVHKSKRKGNGIGGSHKRLSMKNKTMDFDQIVDALKKGEITQNGEPTKELPLDEDKPGNGQVYCGVCDKFFLTREIFLKHCTQTPHKLRVKRTKKQKPWTLEDSKGRIDNGPKLNRKPWDNDLEPMVIDKYFLCIFKIHFKMSFVVIICLVLLTNYASAEELNCELYTLCNSCTEMQGDEFRPIARGCVWCEQSFTSYCLAPTSSNCSMSRRKTFGNCGFTWIPVLIILFAFGILFFVYGLFIVIIKRVEYNSYMHVLQRNRKDLTPN